MCSWCVFCPLHGHLTKTQSQSKRSVMKADVPISCCSTWQNLPNKTSVFLLKAGSFTTSSYVTRSSWSNTGSEMEKESKRMWRGTCSDKQQFETLYRVWEEQGVVKSLKHIWSLTKIKEIKNLTRNKLNAEKMLEEEIFNQKWLVLCSETVSVGEEKFSRTVAKLPHYSSFSHYQTIFDLFLYCG